MDIIINIAIDIWSLLYVSYAADVFEDLFLL